MGKLDVLDVGVVSNAYEREPDESSACAGLYIDAVALDGRVIENVEVLTPGAAAGALAFNPSPGDAVLLVGLKRYVASVENLSRRPTTPFAEENIKALPLGKNSAPLKLSLGDTLAFLHKNGSFGLDQSGEIFSQSVDANREITRSERFFPNGAVLKSYNHNRAREQRNADFSNEWTLFDDQDKIIEYKKQNMDGGRTVKQSELSAPETPFADKTWTRERATSVKNAYADSETVKNADGKILFKRVFNPDGSLEQYFYEQNANAGDFLITQITRPDGGFERTLTSDGSALANKISAAPDGSLLVDVGDGKNLLDLKPDALALKSTSTSLLTIGNNIATIGGMMQEIFTALQGLHTEGGPTNHTASTWYTAHVAPIKAKWEQVFD
jgi:hypothetical protein